MTTWLDECRRTLDAMPTQAIVYFRDDDVGWGDDGLFEVLAIFVTHALPITLAVIPAAIAPATARSLAQIIDGPRGLIEVHQHGFAHQNHEHEARSSEFGPSRDLQAQRDDIAAGRALLAEMFGPRVTPVFTPPWNRCTAATGRCLVDLGFRVLSRDSSSDRLEQPQLLEMPMHWDWFGKRHGGRLGPDRLGESLAAELSTGRPVGMMLHHARMDRSDYERLDELLSLFARAHVQVRTMWSMASERLNHAQDAVRRELS